MNEDNIIVRFTKEDCIDKEKYHKKIVDCYFTEMLYGTCIMVFEKGEKDEKA